MALLTLDTEESQIGRPPSEKTLADVLPYSVLALDKPKGPTSHEVASYVRKILHLPKTGHYGTLDANVSGVLPILLGEACKASNYLAGAQKEYVTIARFGQPVARTALQAALARFEGPIYQKPPLASAVKKVLRVRTVHELELLEAQDAFALLRVKSDAGFYVRTLCDHLGEVLGVGGVMHDLRRTHAGRFGEKECITLAELSDRYWLWKERGDEKPLRDAITPLEDALPLPKVYASDGALKAITTGADLAMPGVLRLDDTIREGDSVMILTGRGELACLATAVKDARELVHTKKGIGFDVERVIRSYAPNRLDSVKTA